MLFNFKKKLYFLFVFVLAIFSDFHLNFKNLSFLYPFQPEIFSLFSILQKIIFSLQKYFETN